MKSYSVIIAEDNPCDMDILSNFVAVRNELKLSGKAVNGGEAIKLLKNESFDLIFLDIDMPVFSGFDVINFSGKNVPPHVIITTAFPDFAVEAFDHEALDFLVKPLTINRFNRAIDRFIERLARDEKNSRKISNIVTISGKGYRYLVNMDDIIYISSHGRQTVLHCRKNDRTVPILMNTVHSMLPLSKFIRIHKQYIVNSSFVESTKSDFTGRHFVMLNDEDDTSLPVGRKFFKEIENIVSINL